MPVSAELDPAVAVCLVVNYSPLICICTSTAEPGGASVSSSTVRPEAWGQPCSISAGLARLEMYGTASGRHHEVVSALGATPIDYRTEDFVSASAA